MSSGNAKHQFTVGLFGIGLEAYWQQFAGLRERLSGYLQQVGQKVQVTGMNLINLGLIDTPEKALTAGRPLRFNLCTLLYGATGCAPCQSARCALEPLSHQRH